jgi:hypothetical protein
MIEGVDTQLEDPVLAAFGLLPHWKPTGAGPPDAISALARSSRRGKSSAKGAASSAAHGNILGKDHTPAISPEGAIHSTEGQELKVDGSRLEPSGSRRITLLLNRQFLRVRWRDRNA